MTLNNAQCCTAFGLKQQSFMQDHKVEKLKFTKMEYIYSTTSRFAI